MGARQHCRSPSALRRDGRPDVYHGHSSDRSGELLDHQCNRDGQEERGSCEALCQVMSRVLFYDTQGATRRGAYVSGSSFACLLRLLFPKPFLEV